MQAALFFTPPRRLLITISVIAIALGMVRLGFWQLDRLQQRRISNARVINQISAPNYNLDQLNAATNLVGMEYRSVTVNGVYDFSQQIYLKNQVWQNTLGIHLLTPLLISGTSKAILVDRGWIPFADATTDKVAQYDVPGQVTISGILRLEQPEPGFGRISDPPLSSGHTRLQSWIAVNLDRIQQQMDFSILPVFIQQAPGNTNDQLPQRVINYPDLSDGPHLSYAIQWFSFSLILLIGYGLITRKQMQKKKQILFEGNVIN